MERRLVNIHTHVRTGCGVEMVSVMAGQSARREARKAVRAGRKEAAELAGTASVEVELPLPPFSIGVHPWQVAGMADMPAALAEVEHAAADGTGNGCAAIGEIGLDAAIRGADLGAQAAVFAAQLAIAQRHTLPVVLHCVRAFEPAMETLAEYRLPAVVFHGFVGSPEQAARAVATGYRISFGPRSLSSPCTVDALRTVPLDRIFLETDADRAGIVEVYSRAAALLDIPKQTLINQLYDNYMTVFGE